MSDEPPVVVVTPAALAEGYRALGLTTGFVAGEPAAATSPRPRPPDQLAESHLRTLAQPHQAVTAWRTREWSTVSDLAVLRGSAPGALLVQRSPERIRVWAHDDVASAAGHLARHLVADPVVTTEPRPEIRVERAGLLALMGAADHFHLTRTLERLERVSEPAPIPLSARIIDDALGLGDRERADLRWPSDAIRTLLADDARAGLDGAGMETLARAGLVDGDHLSAPAARLAEDLSQLVAVGGVAAVDPRRGPQQIGLLCCAETTWTAHTGTGEIILATVDRSRLRRVVSELAVVDGLASPASPDPDPPPDPVSLPAVGSWFWVDEPTDAVDAHGTVVGRLTPRTWYAVEDTAPGLVRTSIEGVAAWVSGRAVRHDD